MNKLEIKLANGHKLVAELCEYVGEIPPEISVYIQDEEGTVLQDIVLVRAKEKEIGVIDTTAVGAEVLVWSDKTNEDYTDKFQIDEYNDELKED